MKRNKPFLDRGIPLENTKQKEEKRNDAASKQEKKKETITRNVQGEYI